MSEIEEYLSTIEKRKRKVSVLEKYKDEIIKLRNENCSYEQIRDYLIKYKKISVHRVTITIFCKKLQKENYQPGTTTQSQKDTKTISNQNENTTIDEKSKDKTKIVQLKPKKDPKKRYRPPPKTISDEEFLTLCNEDKITYSYKLYCAGYEEEADRLLWLPDVMSITRSAYRQQKRKDYFERTYFKERKDLDLDD